MNRTTKILLTTTLCILVVGLAYQLYVTFSYVKPAPVIQASTAKHNMAGMDHSMNMATDASDQEKYNRIKVEYIDLLKKQNPSAALSLVEQRVEKDEWLMNHCHPLVHEIGHEAYKKYKDFNQSMKYLNDVCNTGYMHGVIEEYFVNVDDVFAVLETMCTGLDTGRCLHGVGHGLMYYTGNKLPKSLEYCAALKTGEAISYCAGGVFMENFNTDMKLHPSEYLDPKDPFFPCPTQQERFKLTCYYYAPTYYLALHDDDFTAAFAWCNTAEASRQGTCVRGVSSRATKLHINNPLWVEDLCMKASSLHQTDCIDGLIGFYINHYDSTLQGKILCGKMQDENQTACYNGIKRRASAFPEME